MGLIIVVKYEPAVVKCTREATDVMAFNIIYVGTVDISETSSLSCLEFFGETVFFKSSENTLTQEAA